jgi:hypothetical protein
MESRNRFRGNDSASLCSLPGRYDLVGLSYRPPSWESIPGLLKRFTYNTGSGSRPLYWKNCTVRMYTHVHRRIGERSDSAGGGGGWGWGGDAGNPGRGRSKQTRAEREYTPTCLPARTGPQLVRTCPGAGGGEGFDIRGDKYLFVSNPPSSQSQRKFLAHCTVCCKNM